MACSCNKLGFWDVIANGLETVFVSYKTEAKWFSFVIDIGDGTTDDKGLIFAAKILNDTFFRSGETVTGFYARKR